MISSLPLSLSLAGLREGPAAAGPREAIEWAAALGYRSIQLDATMLGLRPRDLDRSARRGVASLLKRIGLTLSGLDLWIPPDHLTDPVHQQRAIDAVAAAIGLAVDLRSGAAVSVSLTFPEKAEVAKSELRSIAARDGITIADFGAVDVLPGDSIGTGLDPAAAMTKGLILSTEVARLAPALASARLSDWNGTRRVCPGRGRLDLLAYGVSLSIAGYTRPLVVDLRDVDRAMECAAEPIAAWADAGST